MWCLALQGTELLGAELISKMESNLSLFQQFCTTTIFSVPANTLLTKARGHYGALTIITYHHNLSQTCMGTSAAFLCLHTGPRKCVEAHLCDV